MKSLLIFIIQKVYQYLHDIKTIFKASLPWIGNQVSKQKPANYVDYNKFLMFGDSITEFSFNQFPGSTDQDQVQFSLGAALQNDYARKLQVLQRGFSGYTSRDALPLIKSILHHEHDDASQTENIKIAYVFFGTNDARLRGKSEGNHQHVPIDKYVQNVKEIVLEFKSRNIPLVVITPGLHDQKLWDKTHPEDLLTGDFRDVNVNKSYQDAIKDAITDVPVLCFHDAMIEWLENNSTTSEHGDYSELLCDGVHLTGTGYKVLYDKLMKLIRASFPEWSPENVEYKFPHWSLVREDTFNNI